MKLNIGCGDNKIDGFVNIDVNSKFAPDHCIDIRFNALPYDDNTVDEIWFCHTLEHIEKHHWLDIFYEFNRVLKPGGEFYITFPDFETCANRWIVNYKGMREYWEATIFGRQSDSADYHVSACSYIVVADKLRRTGFDPVKQSNDGEDHNVLILAKKLHKTLTREDLLKQVVFK